MKTAMILAAGRGERLQPITKRIPKPLCTIRDTPLLEHHIINLAKAGIDKIIINHAYLGGKIRQYLDNGSIWNVEITYSPEPTGGLETGGGIVNALPLLGKDPFLIVNADIYTDYPFETISIPDHSLAHLVLMPKPQDFGLTSGRHITNDNKKYTFTGIALYRPEMFLGQQIGRYSVTPILRSFADQKLITGEVYQGLWMDIGTIERLNIANSIPRSVK